ncbi:hypothetical protein EJB05_27854, partial [Eragrostis curvula]
MTKINVDAAISKNSGIAAAAAIARDETGVFQGASVLVVSGMLNPETMEAVACREGLALAEDLVLRKIRLASDCLNVVKAIHGDGLEPYGHIVREIKARSTAFACFDVVHESRGWRSIHSFCGRATTMAPPTDDDGVDGQSLTVASAVANADMSKLIPSSLPLETRCPPFPLRQLAGFWLPEMIIPGVAAVHARFEPRHDDVFLASFPKSGTTWLKALAFATLHRGRHPPSDPEHPLRRGSQHECVRFFELAFALAGDSKDDVFAAFPSPRVLATHLPYHLLPERVVSGSGGCRVVYVCRDPKDALVSGWHFTLKTMASASSSTAAAGDAPPRSPYTIEEAFELFCEGRCVGGPQWLHVLGYWEASRRWPDKVLFLRYEEMLLDPSGNVRRLAEFLSCPFSGEEEAAGTVGAVVELCSLDSLRRAKASRDATTELAIDHGHFFRKGAAGDWRNHLSPEMAARLDGVVAAALHGSGLTFGAAAAAENSA